MKSISFAPKSVMNAPLTMRNEKRRVLASPKTNAPLFNCLDSCFRRSDMTVSFPRKRESITAKARRGVFSGEIDLYCGLGKLPDVGQPTPGPVEGLTMNGVSYVNFRDSLVGMWPMRVVYFRGAPGRLDMTLRSMQHIYLSRKARFR